MATIYWRGTRAYLNWRENGQQFRVSLGPLEAREAERIRSAKEAELTHGVRIIARLPLVRDFLSEYLDWYEAEHPTTIKKARSEFKRFVSKFGHRQIDTLRPAELEGFKRERLIDDKAAPETVGKEMRRLKSAFKRGIEWQQIDINPFVHVKAPRGVRSVAVKYYTVSDMQALYEANPARAPLWSLMANTGIRRAEVHKARQSDVVNGKLRVESDPAGAGRTKSGRWREIPLNAKALAALTALPDPIVSVHPDTIGDWFAKDAEKAKIGGSLHRLRHTFCAHLAMAGTPLRRIQLYAGHSDYKITERYAHLAPEGSTSELDKLAF